MRLRLERKIRKRLRVIASGNSGRDLAEHVRRRERGRLLLAQALRAVMTDTGREVGWHTRGNAAKLLAIAADDRATQLLLEQFFRQSEQYELWETALAIESLGDRRAVDSLVEALHDANPHRRHAAVRALGWIREPGGRAVTALIDALLDPSQPQSVRKEAAESLAYPGSRRAVEPLISVLAGPDERLRFWSAFALGSLRDRRAISALEALLSDHRVPESWWSVAREAFGALGFIDVQYEAKVQEEIRRVIDDPDATPEDRRWADFYNRQC